MKKIIKNFNWEKIAVYITCLGFIFTFWQSQDKTKDHIIKLTDRISKIEGYLLGKSEKLEDKK